MQLAGKTVLVTGGTSGIGLALARALLAQGATVLVCARDRTALDQLRQQVPAFETYPCDLANPAQVKALVEQVGPRLDGWVNNAGLFEHFDFRHPDKPFERLQTELQVNFTSAAQAMTALVPHFLARPEAAFVTITAGMVYVPLVMNPMYNASKAALHSFLLSLRAQLAGTRVRVIEIAPPMVATRLTEGMAGERVGPEVIAAAAVKALAGRTDNVLVGQAKSLALLSKFFPHLMLNLLNKAALAARKL